MLLPSANFRHSYFISHKSVSLCYKQFINQMVQQTMSRARAGAVDQPGPILPEKSMPKNVARSESETKTKKSGHLRLVCVCIIYVPCMCDKLCARGQVSLFVDICLPALAGTTLPGSVGIIKGIPTEMARKCIRKAKRWHKTQFLKRLLMIFNDLFLYILMRFITIHYISNK